MIATPSTSTFARTGDRIFGAPALCAGGGRGYNTGREEIIHAES
jgi:hypothetical protein